MKSSKFTLEGKTVLVTGASRGIGRAAAKALALNGASVVINYFHAKEKAEEVRDEIKKAGGRAIIVQADVRDKKAVDTMFDAAIKEFGKVDVLVNNANINFPIKPFIDLSWEEIEAKITGELKALYNCSQAAIRDMHKRKSGKLIFISSTLSRHGGFGFSAHSAAKASMDSIARVMAGELGPLGITVNVIGPGLVKTDATAGLPKEMHDNIAQMTPLKRVGEPEDIANAVVMLASNLSDFITGQYIPVNGGGFML